MAPPDDTPATSRALLSQAEAAAACGVSEATIRRARKAGRIQDVQPDPAGGYRIPVSSLLAAGFTLDRVTRDPQVSPPGTRTVTPQTPPAQDDLREQLEALRVRAEEAERRAAIAEAIAAERARSLDDLRLTVKALTAGPAPAPQPQTSAPTNTPVDVPLDVPVVTPVVTLQHQTPAPAGPVSRWRRFLDRRKDR